MQQCAPSDITDDVGEMEGLDSSMEPMDPSVYSMSNAAVDESAFRTLALRRRAAWVYRLGQRAPVRTAFVAIATCCNHRKLTVKFSGVSLVKSPVFWTVIGIWPFQRISWPTTPYLSLSKCKESHYLRVMKTPIEKCVANATLLRDDAEVQAPCKRRGSSAGNWRGGPNFSLS